MTPSAVGFDKALADLPGENEGLGLGQIPVLPG